MPFLTSRVSAAVPKLSTLNNKLAIELQCPSTRLWLSTYQACCSWISTCWSPLTQSQRQNLKWWFFCFVCIHSSEIDFCTDSESKSNPWYWLMFLCAFFFKVIVAIRKEKNSHTKNTNIFIYLFCGLCQMYTKPLSWLKEVIIWKHDDHNKKYIINLI